MFRNCRGRKAFVIVTLCILLLSGCQEAPEEVKENMKEYGKNEQVEEETQITYCKPEELKNTDINEYNDGKAGIKLPENINFSEVSDVEILKIKLADNYIDNNVKRLAELFGVSEEKFVETPSYLSGKYVVGRDDEINREVGIIDNGFVSYVAGTKFVSEDFEEPDLEDLQQYSNVEIDAVYHEEHDDFSSIDVPFESGNEKLSVMCDKAEEFYKANFMYDSNLDYRITDAVLFDNKHLSLNGEWFYKGVCFNDHIIYITDGEEYDFGFTHNVETNYDDKDLMSLFAIHNFQFSIEETEKIKEIIDFNSAVSIVKNEFADFNNLTINEVIPLYIAIAHYETGSDIQMPGIEYEARPVYAFLTKKKMKLSTEDYINLSMYNKFITVDMINGEILTNYENYVK